MADPPFATAPLTSVAGQLRQLMLTWSGAALLPLPVLIAVNPAEIADVACVYLGLACAWLASEILRRGGMPHSRREWSMKMRAIVVVVAVNVALFIVLGYSVGVVTYMPFWLMAGLSATPAIGLVPWLLVRMREPAGAFMAAALIVLACKLTGCVVARVMYGPNYIAMGYVSDDWRTAKVMITVFWSLTMLVSVAGLLASLLRFKTKATAGQAA